MFCLHLSSFQSSPTGSEVSVGVLFREEGGDGGCTFGEVEALSGEIPLPSGNTVLVGAHIFLPGSRSQCPFFLQVLSVVPQLWGALWMFAVAVRSLLYPIVCPRVGGGSGGCTLWPACPVPSQAWCPNVSCCCVCIRGRPCRRTPTPLVHHPRYGTPTLWLHPAPRPPVLFAEVWHPAVRQHASQPPVHRV
jgi:hypothetical protein